MWLAVAAIGVVFGLSYTFWQWASDAVKERRRRRFVEGRIGAASDWALKGEPDPWLRVVSTMRERWPGQFTDAEAGRYRVELSHLEVRAAENGVQVLVASDTEELPSWQDIKSAALTTRDAPTSPSPPIRPGS